MKRFVGIAAAAVAAVALTGQAADAAGRKRVQKAAEPVAVADTYAMHVDEPYPPFHPSYLIFGHPKTDKRVAVAGTLVGIGTTAAFLSLNDYKFFSDFNTARGNGLTTGSATALTTIGCIALSPMVATVFVQRELTYREAHSLAADCVVPFVGGLLVNAAYDAHPEWEPNRAKPVRVSRRVRR